MAIRSIKEPIILVTQTNKLPFVSKSFLKLDSEFINIFEKTKKGPAERYYVRKDGSLFQKGILPKKYLKDEKDFIQIITFHHIPRGGLFETKKGPEKMPPKLYEEFLKANTDKKLSKFIDKYDFCDFPVSDNCKQRKSDEPYLKYWSPRKGTRGLNWLHICRYQRSFSCMYKDFQKNYLNINNKKSLQIETAKNVISLSFDKNSLPFQEIKNFEEEYKFDINEFFGFKKINQIEQINGYIIFGHYALCCLEFLKDIENHHQRFCVEKHCLKPIPPNAHGNQKRCSEKDNPKCHKKYKAKTRKKERENVKKRGKVKKQSIPKRNY